MIGFISALVYAAGMTTNDLFDAKEDAQDRPFRPIPSGRVKVIHAWIFAFSLQLLAMVLTCWSSFLILGTISKLWTSVTALTIAATYLYNGPFKSLSLSPLIMGLCRFGNFWIGAIALWVINTQPASSSDALISAISLSTGTMIYVTALTALSRHEIQGGKAARFLSHLLVVAALIPLIWLAFGWLSWGVISAGITALWLSKKSYPLLLGEDLSGASVRTAVGAGIRGVALVNVSICLGLNAWWTAGTLLLLVWSAGRVGRWFYAT